MEPASTRADLIGSSQPWSGALRALVRHRALPHLMARHAASAGEADAARRSLSYHQLAAFTAALLAQTEQPSLAMAESFLDSGHSLESLFLAVLVPAARHLGDLWSADHLSFLDVTRGCTLLHGLLRRYGRAFEATRAESSSYAILIAPAPGEQHVFGTCMLAAFFRRAGWRVRLELRTDDRGLEDCLRTERFDVLGLSASTDKTVATLPALIARCREVSTNEGLAVLAGGGALGTDAAAAIAMGADGVAATPAAAVQKAQEFAHLRSRCRTVS